MARKIGRWAVPEARPGTNFMKQAALTALLTLILGVIACQSSTFAEERVESATGPQIILQRLGVAYLGLDGQFLIGSGCPGVDGEGNIENYHFVVSGVNPHLEVKHIFLLGDNSTLTWAWPCENSWALLARDMGNGNWEIFIAPSMLTKVYTVMFFYEDDSLAVGMVVVP